MRRMLTVVKLELPIHIGVRIILRTGKHSLSLLVDCMPPLIWQNAFQEANCGSISRMPTKLPIIRHDLSGVGLSYE